MPHSIGSRRNRGGFERGLELELQVATVARVTDQQAWGGEREESALSLQ